MVCAVTAPDTRRRRWAAPFLISFAALLLGGCDYFPRDPGHSLEQIRARGAIRIGAQPDLPPEAGRLARLIEQATGAKAQFHEGALEPLLRQLEDGELDLVIAPFRKDTPWAAMSALSPSFYREGSADAPIEWRAAMRSGENRWIFLVETSARKVARAGDAA